MKLSFRRKSFLVMAGDGISVQPEFYSTKALMKHLLCAWLLSLILFALWTGLAHAQTDHKSNGQVRPMNVCLALGAGELGDRSFNDSAYLGLKKANRELGMGFHILEYMGKDKQTANLIRASQMSYDLIVAIGYENSEPIKKVARIFPDRKYAVIDVMVNEPNVASIVFRELEGDFLAGALCALLSHNGKIGFLGGAAVPVVRRIEDGWKQGVRYINPQAVIISRYAGNATDYKAFNDPDAGYRLASGIFDEKVEILYAAAGRTGLGAIRAASEKKRLIITTSQDQRWIAPEAVITSRIKNVGQAVYLLIKELDSGSLRTGVRELDMRSGAIALAPFDHPKINRAVKRQISKLKESLLKGRIKLMEY